ncbi:MAG: hypothetical protein M2R45_03576 [Verrucomicrobia subdivision 3 bacterium]|nr:hypothetical protein [Limisphaerales bacterium]
MKTNLSFYAGLAGVTLIILWLVFGWPSAKTRPALEETATPSPAATGAETTESSEPSESAYQRLQKQRTQGSAFPEYFVADENGDLRPPTPEEAAQIKAQDERDAEERRRQAEQEAKEAAYWESRQEWIANFPFEPTHHPEITYDPEMENRLKLEVEEMWERMDELWDGPMDEERDKRLEEMDKRLEEAERRAEKPQQMVDRHVFLTTMYEDHQREIYSPEFEKMHGMLLEAGLEADPVVWGEVFRHLVRYHQKNSHDPEALYPARYMTVNPNTDPPSTEYYQITWEAAAASTYDSLLTVLTSKRIPGNAVDTRLIPKEEGRVLRERLLQELPAEVMLQHHPIIPHGKYENMLKPGDPLLVN